VTSRTPNAPIESSASVNTPRVCFTPSTTLQQPGGVQASFPGPASPAPCLGGDRGPARPIRHSVHVTRNRTRTDTSCHEPVRSTRTPAYRTCATAVRSSDTKTMLWLRTCAVPELVDVPDAERAFDPRWRQPPSDQRVDRSPTDRLARVARRLRVGGRWSRPQPRRVAARIRGHTTRAIGRSDAAQKGTS
jgi:hypothetical protein